MFTLVPPGSSKPPPVYVLGLSIGQCHEPTALAILRRETLQHDNGRLVRDANGVEVYRVDCVDLERFPIGTSYPAIAEAVALKIASDALQPARPENRPSLALEITGIGRATADLFVGAGLPVDISIVTSTGGIDVVADHWLDRSGFRAARWIRLPKADLVATVQASLQAERLKIAKALPLAKILRQELLAFRATPARADELSGRERTDDDLVFAVASAAWLASHPAPNIQWGFM